MSYYFSIVGTRDQPLFELEFGTSKQGGDGVARFSQEARQMSPFIVHAALDYVDELQWMSTQMYAFFIIQPAMFPTTRSYLPHHLELTRMPITGT